MVTTVTWFVTACYRLLPGCYRVVTGMSPGIAASSWTPVFSPELADMFDEIDIGKNILEL